MSRLRSPQRHPPLAADSSALKVPEGKEASVLFLCSRNIHKDHDNLEVSTGGCGICRLIDKFADAIKKESNAPLQRELRVKVLKLRQAMNSALSTSTESSTLENNFLQINDELDGDDEEVLTFTEALDIMDVEVPEDFRDVANAIIVDKKIPIARKDQSNLKQNRFLSYTLNKKIHEICELLTLAEICSMKEALNNDKEGQKEVYRLTAAFEIIQYKEELEKIKGMKEIIFFYIILNMLKESMLNRIYTHSLGFFLEYILNTSKEKDRVQKAVDILKRYLLTDNPPGVCIIFSMQNDKQEGRKEDVLKLKTFFGKSLNYNVLVKVDPTSTDIKKMLMELNASRYMFYDSLVVCFMGHGDKSKLYVKDGPIHRRIDLLQPFSEIGWLKHKPKLFFIQACADREPRKSVTEESCTGLRAATDSISFGMPGGEAWRGQYGKFVDIEDVNALSNTLVSYATMWYCKAATTKGGSLYFNSLVDSLRRYGSSQSIEDVLRDMHYKVNTVRLSGEVARSWKQTPYFESSLSKKFIFPKIIPDDSS